MIRLSEQLLREDSERLQQKQPIDFVALGQILHWLRNPLALAYLQQATREQATRNTDDPEVLIRMGHVARLADDPARAQQYWQRAYDNLHDALQQAPSAAELFDLLHWLSMICFLTGRDAEAESTAQLAATAAQRPRDEHIDEDYHHPPLLYPIVDLLARARRTQTPTPAVTALEQLVGVIKRYHISIGETRLMETGFAPLWDWYDLALGVLRDLAPNQVEHYRPILVPGITVPSQVGDAPPHTRALYYLQSYRVHQVTWVYYLLESAPENGDVAFEQIRFADGQILSSEDIEDYELLDALWTCFEIMAEEGMSGGQYQLDMAQRRIRRIASVLNHRGWDDIWEPETLDELHVTPLPEHEQEVIELRPDELVIQYVYGE